MPSDPAPERSWPTLVAPALVHVFTASGIVCALFAAISVHEGNYAGMFAWLGLALLIDGVDGTFARWFEVERRLPRFSGAELDHLIDYITYVFVPVLALLHAGLLTGGTGVALAAMILMSSLYHFADTASKTADHFFVGFPAIWNVVAFYLFAFAPPVWVVALAVLVLVGLTFVPMRWLHPMRVERLRAVTLAAMALWLVAAAVTVWSGFPASFAAKLVLAAVGLYALAMTLLMPWSRSAAGDTV